MNDADFETVKRLGDQVEFFCKPCQGQKATSQLPRDTMQPTNDLRAELLSFQQAVVAELHTELANVHKAISSNATAIEGLSKSTINTSVPVTKNPSYSDLIKRNESSVRVPQNDIRSNAASPIHTVVLKNVEKTWLSVPTDTFLRKLSSHLPRLKITKLSKSPKGTVFVHCHDQETADHILSQWKPNFFWRCNCGREILWSKKQQICYHQKCFH